MVPYKQRVQAYLTKSVDSLFRTIQFSNGVVRAMDRVVISDLKNVSDTAPGDGDVLEWSAAQGKWVPGPGGGGVIPTLQQVMDQGAAYTGTNNFKVKTAPSTGTNFAMIETYGNKEIVVYSKDGTRESELNLQGSTAFISRFIPSGTNPNARQKLTFIGDAPSSYKMEVEDQAASKGLEYAADYKANFTANSLVNKAYVDGALAGVGNISANTIPTMNAGGTAYIDSPLVSDGTTLALNTSLWSGSLFQAHTTGNEVYVANITRATAAAASERTTMLVDAGAGGATVDNIALRASSTIGAAGSNAVSIQGVARSIVSPSTAGITDASIGVFGFGGNGSTNSSNEAIGGAFVAGVDNGGLPIGVYSSTYGAPATAEVKLFYGTTSVSNSADNIGMKIDISNPGTGNAYGLQLQDGTEGAGKFLQSDANGKAQWATVPAGATDINGLSDAISLAVNDNLGLGSGALTSITVATGDSNNTAVGHNAANKWTGQNSVYVGSIAGQNMTSGNYNVAIGHSAMGASAGGNVQTNVAIGASALTGVTGPGNIGIGNSAGSSISSGGYNICLGRNANALGTGSYQIAVGQGMTTTTSNTLALGKVNYTLLHGEFGTQGQAKLGVNLGNTYTAPTANLHVRGNANDATTALFTTQGGGTLFRVNYNGNVGIGVDPQQELHIRGNQAIIRLEAQASTGANYLEFWDPSERKGYIGYGSSSNDQLSIVNDEHGQNVNMWTTNSGGTTVKGLEIDGNQDVTISNGNLIVTGQAYSSTHTLTAGATVTPDFDNGNVQTVTLDQATTLGNPTNLKDGATYIVIVKQPAAANHTLAFGTAYKFEGGTAPTITAANGATDVLTFVSDGTNLYGAAALNFS